ncbi:hypothetical protein N7501_002921 [Penicillium viridicatum]|nr:hypothetical protein N7501_002921 [Penicillium viridicatum]
MATTGPPTTIRPDAFPDFFTMGCRSGTRQDLARREFLTHCPAPPAASHMICNQNLKPTHIGRTGE